MADEGVILPPLHLRSARVEGPEGARYPKMQFDERYTEHIRKTGLLPFIHLAAHGMPKFNPCAITALVDRWRPETHTFHLPCGEMTMTLQDVSMILALPIKGGPLCLSTNTTGWRELMISFLGKQPGIPNKPAGAPFSWIASNFAKCPPELAADSEEVQQYARAYMWYVISRVLFPDGSGAYAPFMWLKMLAGWGHKLSWGTATLAYLYRQLDEACRRGEGVTESNIGGCMLLLSVWSWEHFPIGRPKPDLDTTWDDHGDPLRRATWAHRWDGVSREFGTSKKMYMEYTNDFDTLAPEHVSVDH
ncbi:unnamed protein product [Alopecurus aequalis]